MSQTTTPEKHAFEAEVGQVLDIVINSLYTDKEIFVRELVSNASDALEKLRHLQLTESAVHQPERELEIRLSVDAEARTVTVTDSGLGMTREELRQHLGTIAHSGSKAFIKTLDESKKKESALIGQFGVGFYSAFMVADEVRVLSRTWLPEGESLVWHSDGKSGYEIEASPEELDRGTSIVVHLREDFAEFADEGRLGSILESYSSFVPFPVLVGEERVNKIEALWRKKKSEVSEEEYREFYRFSARAFDEPRYHLHFGTDVPLELNALLFVPSENTEIWGMGPMEPGVALYCRNILIDDKPEGLLPAWLRFLRGVIDSADLPLNISRESMQDSTLVRKLNRVVTKRFLKFLDSEAKDDPAKYREFYGKFGRFLKEGVVTDHDHRENLGRLLRFESSMTEKGELASLDDYLARAREGQEEIYYLVGPDRRSIENGPHLEALAHRKLEVLFLYEGIDEYLVQHLREYEGKRLVSAASSELKLEEAEDLPAEEGEALDAEALEALCGWLKEEFGEQVAAVRGGQRLVSSPVVALVPGESISPQMRQIMRAMNPDEDLPAPKAEIEINPRHSLIRSLARTRESRPELAKLVAAQLLDSALLGAELLEDRSRLVARSYELMAAALGDGATAPEPGE